MPVFSRVMLVAVGDQFFGPSLGSQNSREQAIWGTPWESNAGLKKTGYLTRTGEEVAKEWGKAGAPLC